MCVVRTLLSCSENTLADQAYRYTGQTMCCKNDTFCVFLIQCANDTSLIKECTFGVINANEIMYNLKHLNFTTTTTNNAKNLEQNNYCIIYLIYCCYLSNVNPTDFNLPYKICSLFDLALATFLDLLPSGRTLWTLFSPFPINAQSSRRYAIFMVSVPYSALKT